MTRFCSAKAPIAVRFSGSSSEGKCDGWAEELLRGGDSGRIYAGARFPNVWKEDTQALPAVLSKWSYTLYRPGKDHPSGQRDFCNSRKAVLTLIDELGWGRGGILR